MTTTIQDDFMKAMDLIQPDWFIRFAEQSDMTNYIRTVTNSHSGTVSAKITLRRNTIERLFTPIRAALEAKIVLPNDEYERSKKS